MLNRPSRGETIPDSDPLPVATAHAVLYRQSVVGRRNGPCCAEEGIQLAVGTVKWFSNKKGYGFIAQEGGEDVFVHHSKIESDGYRTLSEGQRVEFEVVQGNKGLQASGVRVLT